MNKNKTNTLSSPIAFNPSSPLGGNEVNNTPIAVSAVFKGTSTFLAAATVLSLGACDFTGTSNSTSEATVTAAGSANITGTSSSTSAATVTNQGSADFIGTSSSTSTATYSPPGGGGGNLITNPTRNSTFDDASTDWAGAALTGVAVVGNELQITGSPIATIALLSDAGFDTTNNIGNTIRISFDYDSAFTFQVALGGQTSALQPAGAGAYSVDLTISSADDTLQITSPSPAASGLIMTVDNVVVEYI